MVRQTRPSRALKILFFGLLFLFSCSAAPTRLIVNPANDILVDPDIIYGRLDNGFQYILMENPLPDQRVNIHLNVFTGSLNETDDQQGAAHFLEHMVFNGSEHFKPGELVEYFQSIGMDFGADANAHTSFFNTGYDLSLPKSDPTSLDQAFVVIQDYARGALLQESEIDRERGIILAEKRERDSISYRTFKKSLEFELPGSFINQRFPIGIDRTLKRTDKTLLRSYYDQWYRPDNMVLVVVGDFDVQTVLPMIEQRFSRLKPRTLFEKKPASFNWKPHQGIKPFYHYESEAGSTDIMIETVSWKPFEVQTLETLKQRTLESIANSMLQNRLSRMVRTRTADFSSASVFSGPFLHHISLSAIHAVCEPLKWEQGLGQIEKALRQGLEYGFVEKELDRVKVNFISSLENQVSLADSRKSPEISRQILAAVNQKGLLLSPQQQKDLLVPYIASISLEDAHRALEQIWSKDHRLVLVTGNADIPGKNPEARILDVYEKSLADRVSPYQGFESKIFPYLELPASPVRIKTRQDNVKGLGITVLELENNIRLNLKPTDFKQNEFLFKVSFGEGKKSEPISKPGLAVVAEDVIQSSGLGGLDKDQLEEALAGKKVEFRFDVNENYFSFSGSADPKETGLVFQIIYHYFHDPGYREEALNLSTLRYHQQYDALMRTPDGIMQIKGDAFLAKNDPRFGLPEPEIMDEYTLSDVKAWLHPFFVQSPIEISIAGDFELEHMINLASRAMGGFEQRKNFSDQRIKFIETGKIGFPSGEQLDLKPDTRIDSGQVHVAFLTDDFWDIMQTRRLLILSRVVAERLRLVLREDLGQTYSPYVYNDPSLGFDNYGVMHVVVNVKPGSHYFVYNKIREILSDLYEKGISEKETDLALEPVLNHLNDLQKTNHYWRDSVLANASNYPQKFEWARDMISGYTSIDQDDLTALVKKYLGMENYAVIMVKPETQSDQTQ